MANPQPKRALARRVLGIDPGTRFCGYGVVELGSDGPQYIECGVLTADQAKPMEWRLGEIAKWLGDVINELRPGEVAVEQVFSHINPKTALVLAQARGMVLAVAGLHGLQVSSYAPTMIKKTVTGRGRASKDQVTLMVQTLFGLKNPPQTDAADALAIAWTHCQSVKAAF